MAELRYHTAPHPTLHTFRPLIFIFDHNTNQKIYRIQKNLQIPQTVYHQKVQFPIIYQISCKTFQNHFVNLFVLIKYFLHFEFLLILYYLFQIQLFLNCVIYLAFHHIYFFKILDINQVKYLELVVVFDRPPIVDINPLPIFLVTLPLILYDFFELFQPFSHIYLLLAQFTLISTEIHASVAKNW